MSFVIPREQLCGYLRTIGPDLESEYVALSGIDVDRRYSEIARCLMYIPISSDTSEYMWGDRDASMKWAQDNLHQPYPILRWTNNEVIMQIPERGSWLLEVLPRRYSAVDRNMVCNMSPESLIPKMTFTDEQVALWTSHVKSQYRWRHWNAYKPKWLIDQVSNVINRVSSVCEYVADVTDGYCTEEVRCAGKIALSIIPILTVTMAQTASSGVKKHPILTVVGLATTATASYGLFFFTCPYVSWHPFC